MVIVMTKRTFNLNLRVSPELDSAFDINARRVGQTKSNLLTMLMEAFNKAMDADGHVVMPLQVKTPADCAPPPVHTEHNVAPVINGHGNHVRTNVRGKTRLKP